MMPIDDLKRFIYHELDVTYMAIMDHTIMCGDRAPWNVCTLRKHREFAEQYANLVVELAQGRD